MEISQKRIRSIIMLVVIFGYVSRSEKCYILTCEQPNEANEGECFDYESIQSGIKMFPASCESCQILLSQIVDDTGLFISKGLDSYKNCQPQVDNFKKYSGESCSQDADCYSQKCLPSLNNQNVCQGIPLDGNCNDSQNKYCDVGLACDNGKCIKLKNIGESCENTTQCGNNSFCFTSTCTKMRSLQNGNQASDEKQQRVDMKCSSFLAGNDGKCIPNNSSLLIQSCPSSKKCTPSSPGSTFSCNLFLTEKLYEKSGGFSQKIQTKLQELLQIIESKNQLCPMSIKYSSECHLIENEVIQLNEIKNLYNNLHVLINMPKCLHDQLLHKDLYDLFIVESKVMNAQLVTAEDKGNLNSKDNKDESDSDDQLLILIAVFVVLLFSVIIGGYFYLRRRKFQKLSNSQNHSEATDSLPSNRRQNSGSKNKEKQTSHSNSINKESLNLEYNPTSAKGDNQIDISNLQPNQDPKKNGHLETSVNQNFFSIDGEDEKVAKIVDSLDDNRSESDVSYENVFNIEGEDAGKPNSARKRRRQTNRKKIVKKDSQQNNYEVVEE